MLKLWVFVSLFLYAPMAWAGQAVDERPTTPDYSKLYYMGYNNATSSSPCIGNPVTPECAVETYEACINRWDQKLCDMMGYTLPEPKASYDKRVSQIYKFVSKRILTKDDIPEHYRDTWQEGNTVIFKAVQVCTRYEHCYTALKDRSDPKGVCPPLDCKDVGDKQSISGKHAPDIYILQQNKVGKWSVVEMLRSYYLDRMEDRPEKLFQEGLAQMPW